MLYINVRMEKLIKSVNIFYDFSRGVVEFGRGPRAHKRFIAFGQETKRSRSARRNHNPSCPSKSQNPQYAAGIGY
jgi:hypothetical protein